MKICELVSRCCGQAGSARLLRVLLAASVTIVAAATPSLIAYQPDSPRGADDIAESAGDGERAGRGYSGSEACASCHQQQWQDWQSSHHFQAMRPATETSVLGDFNDARFEYGGYTHRFQRRDGQYRVMTDNAEGELQEFTISHTFGFYPLQQYLVGFPDGRYQALSIVWDSRPAAQGGQRWYHLYPEEVVDHRHPLHWTGSFQNWNSRCASCHSTDLRKNYDTRADRYATTWSEVSVGCEACHGPATAHVEWARGGGVSQDNGLAHRLPPAPVFAFEPGAAIARLQPGSANPEPAGLGSSVHGTVETCAACHSRRAELVEASASIGFHDRFELRLLEQGLYYPDGQVQDEVFVFGSFLQSRMHRAGVTCSNCHQPHSGELRAAGNAVCAQCHLPAVFETSEHHHHPLQSAGSACADCHMPATTYMGVDDRRDHSFSIPRPELTIEFDIPNACNRCHQDEPASWAVTTLNDWFPARVTGESGAHILAAARANQPRAVPALAMLANDTGQAGILRATAVLESGRFPGAEAIPFFQVQLESTDPLVRAAAVRALEFLPAPNRYSLLQPLLTDPVRSVRLEAIRQLADVRPEQLSANGREPLIAAFAEYREALQLQADSPEGQLGLGIFELAQGRPEQAERAYHRALKLSPGFIPARLNLADLYRANGLERQAEEQLLLALSQDPDNGATRHALGLLRVRQGRLADAVNELRRASELEPVNVRYRYVLAVALWESGQQQRAIAVLEDGWTAHRGDPQLRGALAAYYQQLGETDKLRQLEMDG